MTLIGALKVAKAGQPVKKAAPFYSAVDEALGNLKRPKGTGIEFLTEVMKTKGVKKAEIADRKLEQAFKAKGKMTKEEAQQVLADNPPPKLKEKVYDESTAIDEEEIREMVSQEMFGKPYDEIYKTSEMRRILDEVYNRMDKNLGTKYGEYRTPDGENYREILLKLPQESSKITEAEKNFKLARNTWEKDPTQQNYAQMQMAEQEREVAKITSASYRSGHWEDDANVLAHMRVQDRKGPNGEKILHVEEIQSDWHQAGRKKGYKPDDYIEQSNALERAFNDLVVKRAELKDEAKRVGYFGEGAQALTDEANSITPQLMKLQEQRDELQNIINYGVPDAPFKKNWHELAMKRLLNYAAENDYDSIAITPGAEQAKRYSLSKQLDEVIFDPNTGHLSGRDHNGKLVVAQKGVTTENLPDYIGKEGAQKILESPLDESGVHALRGADLEVGGEGMKGFYDKMLPDYLNTFGKPYGAQIQMNSTPVSTRDPKSTSWGAGMPGDHPFITVQDLNEPFDGMVELMRRNADTGEETLVGRMTRPESERLMAQELKKLDTYNQIKLHNFPITPEMRESIKTKGLPLYQQVGIPTAGAGAASQMLEPQEEPEYSKGGSIAKMAALAKMKKLKEEMTPRAEAVKSLIARDQNRYLADVVPNSLTNPEIEAEIRRMAARAKASGQQEGVLPLAEREANKAKYLEKSKEKNVMYHGTDQDISEFRPYTFVTPDPKVANQYPGLGQPRGQNIMPVHVRAENPFDYEIPSHVHKLSSIIKDKELLRDIKDGYWQSIENPDVLEAMQKLGFDSFYSPDMAKNIGVFKPEQIKSAIGNRGTFDPLEREVNKATGGAIAKMALKAAPAPKAPQIIKPSTLTELKKIVEKEKGGYGARRVERAADEVPNLENMYTLDALKERFTGDNAKALMTMSPADFEKFATELQGKTSVGPKAAESAKQGEISKYTVPTNEYVKHLERIAMFDSVPYLNLAKEEVGLPLLPYVSGHEGRHRSRALAGKGEKRNLVGVTPTMDLREGLPRRSQEEFIEAMKKELELSGGLVLPQSEPMMGGRPPIILPDVYAKGGSVKPQVKKSVSGKVKMSDNRDAMFMELSNKKLKRK